MLGVSVTHLHDGRMDRWNAVLDLLLDVLGGPGPRVLGLRDPGPPGLARVVVRGDDALIAVAAPRLADALRAAGRSTVVGTGADEGDIVIGLRRRRPGGWESAADIVIDMSDPDWPVVRHIDAAFGYPPDWHDRETRAFFAVRAATWDHKFGDDGPAYARAVQEMELAPAATAIDVGCGTGRALPALRSAVGPQGTVLGLDYTPEMLAAARPRADDAHAVLVLADARRLPLAPASTAAVFAAGLVGHHADAVPLLSELARVCAAGGRLGIFHPSGRAALAARHGRTLRENETLVESRLEAAMHQAGWALRRYDDAPERFFALADRLR
jgi:SAM-dependent methyltransferase